MSRKLNMRLRRFLTLVFVVASLGAALAGYFLKVPETPFAVFILGAFGVITANKRDKKTPNSLITVDDASSSSSSVQNSGSPTALLESAPIATQQHQSYPQGMQTLNQSSSLVINDLSESFDSDGIADPVTGMMNDLFFAGLLGTKVATARRRLWPVSIALLYVNFGAFVTDKESEDHAASQFAQTIQATIRDADVACRISKKTFVLILDDTDEDGAAWAAERIQLSQARKGDSYISKVSAGVASYPSHGIEAPEILAKAREALEKAVNNADLPGLGLVIVAPQRPL